MQQILKSKVALVTGGARGIGRAIAVELARAGAAVAIGDLDQRSSEGAIEAIRAVNSDAIALPLDVTDAESGAQCVQAVVDRFSRLDILVNNAAIFQSRLGFELDDRDFNGVLDVNLTGIWRMARAAVPHFKTQGGGRIVNIASVGGRKGTDFGPAYCASKAGVISLTQSLALALGADNVTVNAVCPGGVATDMMEQMGRLMAASRNLDPRQFPARVLPGDLAAEDIAHAVVFFASGLARNITGQALNVDGGIMMN